MTARSRPPEATAPSLRRRSRRGEGERLREDILDAAEQLLVELGDEEAVSIRAIARRVGVTAPAIYLHFADKAELLFAVCERHFLALDVATEAAAGTSDDPLESLRRRGAAYVRFGVENPEHYRILFMGRSGATPVEWHSERLMGSSAFGHLVAAVQRCIDAGVFRPVDPLIAAKGLWVVVHGLASLFVARPDFPWGDRDALVDHVLATHAIGLAAND